MVSSRSAIVLFSCFVLCSVEYVSAANKCQICISNDFGDCAKYPTDQSHYHECKDQRWRNAEAIRQNSGNDQHLSGILGIISNVDTTFSEDYMCGKVEGITVNNDRFVARTCLAKSDNPCRNLLNPSFLRSNGYVKNCTYCDTDGCNSSSAIKAGLWTFFLSLAVLLYIKQ